MTKEPSDDYYALLGIDAEAGAVELRRAWRRLALRWHPDRAGPAATATFQKISAAYAVLSNPGARAEYDLRRGHDVRSPAAPPREAKPGPAAADGPRAPGVLLSRLSGPLNALIASGAARRAKGDVIELFIREAEAAQGGMATISMYVKVRCPSCRGAATPGYPQCDGAGTVEELYSAWLAVRPGVADGAMLAPSAQLPGVVRPVSFRMRRRGPR